MRILVLSIVILFASPWAYAQEKAATTTELTGLYLGQKPPGKTPVIFAPGLISSKENTDFSSCFSPDGTEFYFSRRAPEGANQLMFSKIVNDNWTHPQPGSFVQNHTSSEAHISPNGNYLFMGSRVQETSSGTVWYSERKGTSWSTPKKLNENMMYATMSLNNRLYYTDKSGGNISNCFLKTAQFKDGELIDIKPVVFPNESGMGRAHPYISPNEDFLIYDQMGDLYVTFSNNDQTWSPSKKLNAQINTNAYEFAAHLSADGKYLFFTRDDNIYWVDASIIEDLRP